MQSDELQAEQVHFPARNPIASRKWRWSIDDDHVKRAAKTLSKKKKTKTSYCRKNRTELQWSHWHQSVFLATTTAAADDVIAQLFSLSSWMGLAMVIGSWSQPSRPVGLAIRPGLSLSLHKSYNPRRGYFAKCCTFGVYFGGPVTCARLTRYNTWVSWVKQLVGMSLAIASILFQK